MSNFLLIKDDLHLFLKMLNVSKNAEWFNRPEYMCVSTIFLDNRKEHGPENSVHLSL